MTLKTDKVGYEDEYIKVLNVSSNEIQEKYNLHKVKQDTYYDTLCKRCNKVWILSRSNIGKVKSCGCYMKTKWKDTAEDHIGEKYNQLTIIGVDWERTECERNKLDSPTKDTFYFTKCDCGAILDHSTRYNSMKYGHIKSCGCSKFNNPLIVEDLTGQKFSRLTVIGRDIKRDMQEIENGKKRGNVHWLCQCDCGNPKLSSVTGYQLKNGHTQSCGCYASEQIAKRNKKYSTKINTVKFDEEYAYLYDDNNNECIIDKEDYDYIKQWFWRRVEKRSDINKGYWVTNTKKDDEYKSNIIMLHQIIAELKFGEYNHSELMPDHLSRNPNDNRKCDIVLKTNIENTHNRSLSKANTSGKTGVRWDKTKQKWQAYITVNYKNNHLGYFNSFEDAVNERLKIEEKYGFTCDEIYPEFDTD